MKTLITFAVGILLGVTLGCIWNFYRYEPIKLIEQNQQLELDIHILNKAYVRDISKKHKFIDDNYKIKW